MDLEEKSLKIYNSLREFYDEPDRREFLEYVIKYTEMEAQFLGIEYEALASFRGYLMLADLYEENLMHITRGGQGPLPLEILTEKQILADLKEKYGGSKTGGKK